MPKRGVRGFLSPYEAYNFRRQDPVVDVLRTAMDDHFGNRRGRYKRVEELGGPKAATLGRWFNGHTMRPQFAALNATARTIDLEFILVPMGGRMPAGAMKPKLQRRK